MLSIILNAVVQADSIGNWAVGLVFAGVVYFAGNRMTKLIDKIDSVTDFVINQIAKNGHTDEKIKDLADEYSKLETELKDQVNRIEKKLDNFISEIRRDRVS